MMRRLNKLWIFFVAAVMLLAACTPASGVGSLATPTPEPMDPTLTPYETEIQPPAAVKAAQEQLASLLGIPSGEITIRSIEETDFPNTCLGLGGPDEACGEAIVRGYRAVIEAGGKTYEARASLDGKQVRFADASGKPLSIGKGMPEAAMEDLPAVAAARQFLASETGIQAGSIKLISAEAVQWPNSCLGIERPEETCLMAITPGYRVVFEANGEQFQVNTNEDGSAVRMAGAVEAQPPSRGPEGSGSAAALQAAQQLLAQQLGVQVDEISLLTLEPVEWPDACLGVQMSGRMCAQMITPGYRIVLQHGGQNYEFRTDQAGGVVLPASSELTEAGEQVLTWHREGGIAGFCSDMTISNSGLVQPISCKGGQQRAYESYQMNAKDLEQLQAWLAKYASFEYLHDDKAVADSMLIRMTFVGKGTQKPAAAQQEEIAQFAARIFAESTR